MIYYVSNITNRIAGAVWGEKKEDLERISMTPYECRAVFIDDNLHPEVFSDQANYIIVDGVPVYSEAGPPEELPPQPPTMQEQIASLQAELALRDDQLHLQNERFLQLSDDLSGFMDYVFEMNPTWG